ncbi:MAG: hypothetical protein ACKV2U_10870 [Bryobacteraceae bacterium]
MTNSKLFTLFQVTILVSAIPLRAGGGGETGKREAWVSQAGQLPGLHSGKSIAIKTALLGGAVVGGLLVYRHYHRRGPATKVEMPARLGFSGSNAAGLVIRNNGAAPISVSELTVQGGGFEVTPEAPMPLLVRAGSSVEVPVKMKSGGGARLQVTFIEGGRERTSVVKLEGKPEPVRSSRAEQAVSTP